MAVKAIAQNALEGLMERVPFENDLLTSWVQIRVSAFGAI
jgi:hypothetical protein